MRSAAYRPQAGFPVALYEDDPAQTIFLCGISLPAAHTRVAPVPAALVLVRSAAALHLAGYAVRLFVLAVIPARGAAGRIAPAVNLRKNPRILCGLCAGSHDAAVGQLHGRFRGRSFLPVRLLCVPHYLAVQTALYCHSTLSQISAPSDVGRWMRLDILTAYPLHSRFVLGCLE